MHRLFTSAVIPFVILTLWSGVALGGGNGTDSLLLEAQQGSVDAQYRVGLRYFQNRDNSGQNFVEALRWFNAAAQQHHALAEEYLADHFPTFPVMPGVLMLETLVEAGAWLLRLTEDYRHSVIVLRDARNVKYGSFMQPGYSLIVTAEMAETAADAPEVVFKGKGEMDGASTVSAKYTLARYNLGDRDPALVEPAVMAFLNSTPMVLWAKKELGLEFIRREW